MKKRIFITFINFLAYLRKEFFQKLMHFFLVILHLRHFQLSENLMKNHLLENQLVLIKQKDYHLQVRFADSFAYMDYNFQLTLLAANLRPYQLKPKNFCRFV